MAMTGLGPAFVAEDPTIRQSLKLIGRAVERRLPTLLRGPSGTDRDMMSREAHHLSSRKDAFVPVNCATQPESLIEAALCGHKEGALPAHARGGSAGLVVEADGGTLFLDEIGGMRPALQTVLLRLLDD
ncbi:Sigma-54 interaction domain-containing protein [Arboricoccus pini]|uniref:Sigma-54 interaction domain-containing protein n=1 Tax=Arboricoccus pini TaxID=1963835 RepID=A0A212RGA2_9PROT|nr:Sigma-54 interaction domain-containing protein [Arboricoccus pini]